MSGEGAGSAEDGGQRRARAGRLVRPTRPARDPPGLQVLPRPSEASREVPRSSALDQLGRPGATAASVGPGRRASARLGLGGYLRQVHRSGRFPAL